jgi:hypothetical protein
MGLPTVDDTNTRTIEQLRIVFDETLAELSEAYQVCPWFPTDQLMVKTNTWYTLHRMKAVYNGPQYHLKNSAISLLTIMNFQGKLWFLPLWYEYALCALECKLKWLTSLEHASRSNRKSSLSHTSCCSR